MGFLAKLKKLLTVQRKDELLEKKAELVNSSLHNKQVSQQRPYARIRPLDLLDKLDKLDELSLITIRLDQLKERSNLILESVARHDNRVLDKLDLLDELSLISNKLDNALSGRVVEAVRDIKLTFKLQEILEVFKQRGILSTREVSLMFGTTTSTESKHLKELEYLEKIECIRRGVYRLREHGPIDRLNEVSRVS